METYVYKQVNSISFGLFSPKDIKKMAAVKIVTPELYDKEGYPVDGGLMDIRLGVIDPGLRCKTCGGKLKECQGHFGYIELARPVVHVNYVKPILSCLRGTCKECGRILLAKERISSLLKSLRRIEKQKGSSARRKKINSIIKEVKTIKKCPHCNVRQGVIKIEKPTTFLDSDKKLNPIEVRARLEKIPDEDAILLGLNPGFARPEWMVLTVMAIPPVTMRPSITLESGERSEDDLTHKLGDVVRINQRLFENINAGAPEIIIEDLWDLLQYHITTFFDNTITGIPPARHRSGSVLKTLSERIKSKEGRFRYNLSGKRVNFSARTVISPDPKIRFDEVGIPKYVAMELTVPERVVSWNIDRLKEFIKRGPTVYPGANYVVRPDGKKKKITEETTEQLLDELTNGYLVERHLMDGDVCVFNRQPSLHRMSIMCHRVRILPGKSFRLNPSVCHPYNADFDGDEMNLHIPQNEESRTEAEILMQVQTQVVTPKNGLNVIGCVEDAVTGNYLLTKDMEFSKEDAIQILLSIGVDNVDELKRYTRVNGKQIFSVLLTKDLNFIGRSKGCKGGLCKECGRWDGNKCKTDSRVVIKDGKLLSGVIDENTIGEENGTLVREIQRAYGGEVLLNILGSISQLGIATLLRRGFTTSIADTDLNTNAVKEIDDLVVEAEKKVYELIDEFKAGRLEMFPGKTLKETLELRALEILNGVRNDIGNVVVRYIDENNNTLIMIRSGARGNLLNLAQMSACVGQQSLRGQRIRLGYSDRTLSMFNKNDLGPEARGFIRKGFKSGLKPNEFFFGAMTGRDSLMDTALRTPKSGYLYRRLANALQDLKIEYDNTVRTANSEIVQFLYGEDGLDVSKTDNGSINVKKIIEKVLGD